MKMAKRSNQQKVIGDYHTLHEIGTGSFAVVWKAVHRVEGHEVAIKEIATDRLNKKLQENLSSEIAILRKTDHPNIIRLYDIVEEPNRLYLVLEYCAGGDLAAYLQRCGKVSEVVAKHFMRQLGSGLQVLRTNNLIHRDLKPQNLLLSTSDQNAVLKIADFGFARSLQPQGLAETLCGSPLYMAPEILQYQKYDAKADLWSVGAILFQLLTGRPPFFGNSQEQLLQNITKNEVQFPKAILSDLHPDCIDLCRKLLRQNPVERLSFEEFFNHSFLGLSRFRVKDDVHLSLSSASRSNENPQEDSLPFLIDDDRQSIVETPFHSSLQSRISASPLHSLFPVRAVTGGTIGVSPKKLEHVDESGRASHVGLVDKQRTSSKQPLSGFSSLRRPSETGFLGSLGASTGMEAKAGELGFNNASSSKGMHSEATGILVDSMECIERDYVLVNTSMETLSISLSTSTSGQQTYKEGDSPQKSSSKFPTPSVPVPVVATSAGSFGGIGSVGSHGSTPSGTSQESVDSGDILEGTSSHPPTRLSSLRRCAELLTELATDKFNTGQTLESFSVQLVCLAIWREALHVCHSWAAAAADVSSPLFEEEISEVTPNSAVLRTTAGDDIYEGAVEGGQEAASACSRVEQDFSLAVERADDLAKHVGNTAGSIEMPDAIEIIFQAALAIGRAGAVDELMGNKANAAVMYAKSAALLYFLLIEGSSLPLIPPLVLSPSDRHRLRRYVDMITFRQNMCTNQQNSTLQQQSPS